MITEPAGDNLVEGLSLDQRFVLGWYVAMKGKYLNIMKCRHYHRIQARCDTNGQHLYESTTPDPAACDPSKDEEVWQWAREKEMNRTNFRTFG